MIKTDGISTIEIKGMKFHSYTGLLPKERTEGVDLEVDFKGKVSSRKAVESDDIGFTPDVRDICRIVEEEVGKPCDLLETLADRIALAVGMAMKDFISIKVRVAKLNPGLCGASSWSATASINMENENNGF